MPFSESISYFAILAGTFFISTVTLLTGFGIGTVLTPAFALVYDVKSAVFLVSIVHLANNFLKLGLFRKHIDRMIFYRFGVVSIVGALAGTLLQGALDAGLVGYILGGFLVIAGITEFIPKGNTLRLPQSLDRIGGFLSGFMGGMIGNQGAIRSAYLLNYNLTKDTFVGTATAISIVIDLIRIPLYVTQELSRFKDIALPLTGVVLFAFAGTLLGTRVLRTISLERFRLIVAAFLVVVGIKFFIT